MAPKVRCNKVRTACCNVRCAAVLGCGGTHGACTSPRDQEASASSEDAANRIVWKRSNAHPRCGGNPLLARVTSAAQCGWSGVPAGQGLTQPVLFCPCRMFGVVCGIAACGRSHYAQRRSLGSRLTCMPIGGPGIGAGGRAPPAGVGGAAFAGADLNTSGFCSAATTTPIRRNENVTEGGGRGGRAEGGGGTGGGAGPSTSTATMFSPRRRTSPRVRFCRFIRTYGVVPCRANGSVTLGQAVPRPWSSLRPSSRPSRSPCGTHRNRQAQGSSICARR